jgi:hypothetical protein
MPVGGVVSVMPARKDCGYGTLTLLGSSSIALSASCIA